MMTESIYLKNHIVILKVNQPNHCCDLADPPEIRFEMQIKTGVLILKSPANINGFLAAKIKRCCDFKAGFVEI